MSLTIIYVRETLLICFVILANTTRHDSQHGPVGGASLGVGDVSVVLSQCYFGLC